MLCIPFYYHYQSGITNWNIISTSLGINTCAFIPFREEYKLKAPAAFPNELQKDIHFIPALGMATSLIPNSKHFVTHMLSP